MKNIIFGFLLSVSLVSVANAAETYSKLDCKTVKGKTECKVVKAPKISGDITYLDMSETEGKTDDMPKIVNKGKL